MEDLLGRKNVNFSYILEDPNDERNEKYKQQRMERGFDDTECWNLDLTFVNFMIPRLKVFKEQTQGYPSNMTFEEWHNILDEMIEGFELWNKHFDWEIEEDINIKNENNFKVNKAIDLFKTYFRDLWW